MDADYLYHNYNIMDYASQLANLGLSSLEYHHFYFDLVMFYQIVRKLVDVNVSELFTVRLTYIPLEEATDHFYTSP